MDGLKSYKQASVALTDIKNGKTVYVCFVGEEGEPNCMIANDLKVSAFLRIADDAFFFTKEDTSVPKYGKGHKLSDSDIDRIRALSEMGKSQMEIAKIIGCSQTAVSQNLSRVQKIDKEPGKGHIEWFLDLATQGMGVKAISDRTGYTEAVVRKYVERGVKHEEPNA